MLVDALAQAGLLPSPSHELVRNVMVSPLTGRIGGQADLRETALELDRQLCADPDLAGLAGRFLFVLDDGRGDIESRSLDLGLMAVDAETVQLRIGSHQWGPLVPLDEAPEALLSYAHGSSGCAVTAKPRCGTSTSCPRAAKSCSVSTMPATYGPRSARSPRHTASSRRTTAAAPNMLPVPDGLLTPELAATILDRAGTEVIVTPWRSVVIPDLETE